MEQYTCIESDLGTTGTPIQQWEPKPGELVVRIRELETQLHEGRD